MTQFLEEHFSVADSTIVKAGLGLFSDMIIEPGDTIGHYTGEILSDKEVNQTPYIDSDYIFWICVDHNIVGERTMASYTRYINL
ncbi:MAG: hypothetical protein KZQ56_13100 [gamma proteobacterium symbiont of Lucinoma myriamae]|nr:hypothetical protein [gamma proteobacterium symbiont of Lucinoma myriamae]